MSRTLLKHGMNTKGIPKTGAIRLKKIDKKSIKRTQAMR